MPTPVQTRREVLDRLGACRPALQSLGVRRLGLFGSLARDEAGATSDVDLLVEFATGRKSFDHFMDLADLLEEVLHRPVELVTTEALSPYIGPRILEEAAYLEV